MNKKLPRWILPIQRLAFGIAIGAFGGGMWHKDFARLSLGFLFLALAWAWREMYLGWDVEKGSWEFVKRGQQ